jgi:hypothetical protein
LPRVKLKRRGTPSVADAIQMWLSPSSGSKWPKAMRVPSGESAVEDHAVGEGGRLADDLLILRVEALPHEDSVADVEEVVGRQRDAACRCDHRLSSRGASREPDQMPLFGASNACANIRKCFWSGRKTGQRCE